MNRLAVRTWSKSCMFGAGVVLTLLLFASAQGFAATPGDPGDAAARDLGALVEELQGELVQWYEARDALDARLDALESESVVFRDEMVHRIDQVRQRYNELVDTFGQQMEALAQAELYLDEQHVAFKEKMNNTIEELRLALDLLQQQMIGNDDSLLNRVEKLEKMGSVSEKQIEQLSDSLHNEIDSRMSSALIRERRLESQLNELQEAFNEYKASSHEEIEGLRNTNNILVGVGVLTLVLSFVNAGE